MLDAAERIVGFTAGISKGQFQEDEKLHLAVIRLALIPNLQYILH